MEAALLRLLPLVLIGSLEGVVVYFLVAILSSVLLLAGFILQWAGLLAVSLIIKIGLFPFHSWVPLFAKRMSWPYLLVMLTVQKLPPMFLAKDINNIAFVLVGAARVLVGALLAYGCSELKTIMGCSSIMHRG